jgi:hypothetical protein
MNDRHTRYESEITSLLANIRRQALTLGNPPLFYDDGSLRCDATIDAMGIVREAAEGCDLLKNREGITMVLECCSPDCIEAGRDAHINLDDFIETNHVEGVATFLAAAALWSLAWEIEARLYAEHKVNHPS